MKLRVVSPPWLPFAAMSNANGQAAVALNHFLSASNATADPAIKSIATGLVSLARAIQALDQQQDQIAQRVSQLSH